MVQELELTTGSRKASGSPGSEQLGGHLWGGPMASSVYIGGATAWHPGVHVFKSSGRSFDFWLIFEENVEE